MTHSVYSAIVEGESLSLLRKQEHIWASRSLTIASTASGSSSQVHIASLCETRAAETLSDPLFNIRFFLAAVEGSDIRFL